MSDLQVPYDYIEVIDGVEWYFLSGVLSWLKESSEPIQINPYKRRCSPCNMIKYKSPSDRGKPRVYVNRSGLIEVVEKTRSIKANTKRLLGITSGVVSSESIFEYFLDGLSDSAGFSVDRQFPVGQHRVDFMINKEIAVEFDESDHSSYCKDRERVRERDIERHGYRVVRVNDSDNIGYSLGVVINAIYQKQESNKGESI